MSTRRTTISLPALKKTHLIDYFVNGHEVIKIDSSIPPGESRKAVLAHARFFQREVGCGLMYDGVSACDSVSYLFVDDYSFRREAIGSVCFRFRPTVYEDGAYEMRWWLDWVWFHPYYRGKGTFTEFLPVIKKNHPDCILQYPLSRSMQEFDKKHKLDARHHDDKGRRRRID